MQAKQLVNDYREGKEPAGTTREQVVGAMALYRSAFHPDSGELQNVFGRMSFQMPGGMMITGAMLQFYKTVPQVVFWQWFNQSFNALVNYTNRNWRGCLQITCMRSLWNYTGGDLKGCYGSSRHVLSSIHHEANGEKALVQIATSSPRSFPGYGRWLLPALHGPLCLRTLPTECGDHLRVPATKRPRGVFTTPREVQRQNSHEAGLQQGPVVSNVDPLEK